MTGTLLPNHPTPPTQSCDGNYGDDVRWVGNEKGVGRETEWNATVLTPGIYARSQENNKRLGVFSKAEGFGKS